MNQRRQHLWGDAGREFIVTETNLSFWSGTSVWWSWQSPGWWGSAWRRGAAMEQVRPASACGWWVGARAADKAGRRTATPRTRDCPSPKLDALTVLNKTKEISCLFQKYLLRNECASDVLNESDGMKEGQQCRCIRACKVGSLLRHLSFKKKNKHTQDTNNK